MNTTGDDWRKRYGVPMPAADHQPAKQRGKRATARARPRKQPGKMTQPERKMFDELTQRIDVASFGFNRVTLVLADGVRFTPDFDIVHEDGTIEFREIKAAWKNKKTGEYRPHLEDDARVKVRVAAKMYWWFKWTVYSLIPAKAGGGWIVDELQRHGKGVTILATGEVIRATSERHVFELIGVPYVEPCDRT